MSQFRSTIHFELTQCSLELSHAFSRHRTLSLCTLQSPLLNNYNYVLLSLRVIYVCSYDLRRPVTSLHISCRRCSFISIPLHLLSPILTSSVQPALLKCEGDTSYPLIVHHCTNTQLKLTVLRSPLLVSGSAVSIMRGAILKCKELAQRGRG